MEIKVGHITRILPWIRQCAPHFSGVKGSYNFVVVSEDGKARDIRVLSTGINARVIAEAAGRLGCCRGFAGQGPPNGLIVRTR